MTDHNKQEELIPQESIDKAIEILEKVVAKTTVRGKPDEGVLMGYYRSFIKKMLENFSSAKMLIFFFPLLTSLFFLWKLFGMRSEFMEFVVKHPNAASDLTSFFKVAMDGFIAWCTFTVSLGGTVIVVRETFKVTKLKALKDDTKDIAIQIENIQN